MIGIGTTYSPAAVAARIKRMNCPTPTDSRHGADWWNQNFGRRIIYEYETTIQVFAQHVVQNKLSKDETLRAIPKIQIPTPFNESHKEKWWQSDFGIEIRHSFSTELKRLCSDIENLRESSA